MYDLDAVPRDSFDADNKIDQRQVIDAAEERQVAYEGTIRNMTECKLFSMILESDTAQCFNCLHPAWRANQEKDKQETIEAIKHAVNEEAPYNIQGYLDEFGQWLMTEASMLLSQVGKLREDKRKLELCAHCFIRRDLTPLITIG